MSAAKHDIILEGNSDFEWKIKLTTANCSVIDVDNYGMKMQIRTLNSSDGDLLIEASVTNSRINVNTTTDIFEIDIPVDVITPQIQNFEDNKNRAFYDIVIYPSSTAPTTDPIRLVEGKVKFSKGVTTLI
jgi:hypothetical protein